jgi:hypothetical protein
VVAKWQWMTVATNSDAATLGWQVSSMIALLVLTSLAGILSAGRFLKREPLLITVVAMTALLAVLLSVYPFAVEWSLLYWYARIYAAVCLATPLVYVARAWITPREKGQE